MAVQLRRATEEDYPAIVAMVPTADELFRMYARGRHPFDVDQLRELASIRKELTVAVDGGEVVGFANLYDVDPPRSAFVGNLVVARERRGAGIGRKLMEHMIERALDGYRVREVRLSVFNDNTTALLMYARMGFQPYAIEEMTNPAGKKVGLIDMRLDPARAGEYTVAR